jgi:hypothetical protein
MRTTLTMFTLLIFVLHLCIYWGSVRFWDTSPEVSKLYVERVLCIQIFVILPALMLQEGFIFSTHGTPFWPLLAPWGEGSAAVLAALVGDAVVYAVHREMHIQGTALQRLHDRHLRPISSSAQALDYSTVEVVLLNVLAPFATFHLLGCCRFTIYCAQALGTAYVVAKHSKALRIPCSGTPHWHHELHHADTSCNYSTFGWTDVLLGTFQEPGGVAGYHTPHPHTLRVDSPSSPNRSAGSP